jgi:hypothetical protein
VKIASATTHTHRATEAGEEDGVMTFKGLTGALGTLVVLSLFCCAFACGKRDCPVEGVTETTSAVGTGATTWKEITRAWPDDSKSAAKEMADKYGAPDELTPSQLTWTHAHGPWKRSIVSRDPVHHEWPSPHEDVLEQFIDLRTPPDKLSDLGKFDGSVMVERTKGELSARCGGEAANFLALNLAKDIVDGSRSVDDARHFYETTMRAYKTGQKPEYMQKLRFSSMSGHDAADPDRAAPLK